MKTPDQIIDALGGTVKVSEICEISTGAVSQWRTAKGGIPKPWIKFFKAKYPKVFTESNAK